MLLEPISHVIQPAPPLPCSHCLLIPPIAPASCHLLCVDVVSHHGVVAHPVVVVLIICAPYEELLMGVVQGAAVVAGQSSVSGWRCRCVGVVRLL
jgi:hypothetical protein